jgi:hypothetical protein
MPRYVNPVTQYTDSQGELLVEGFLRFEESGTNTLKPVFHDADLTIQATNPVKLDGAGRTPSLFTSGSYKVTAFKNDGVGGLGEQQWERDPVGSDPGEFGTEWDSATTYAINEIVLASDGNYYESITNNNVGNDPTTTPSAWSELVWFHVWNSLETYAQFDPVQGSDGIFYYSVIGSNLGNDPTNDDGTNWLTAATVSTDALKGVALKSTQAKVDGGTDDDSYVTPLQLESKPAPSFRGCAVYLQSNLSLTNDTSTQVGFGAGSEAYDTDSIHDEVTNNTRLTVPSGVSKIRISSQAQFASSSVGDRQLDIWKGGTNVYQGNTFIRLPAAAGATGLHVQTAVLDVSPGDYFEMTVKQVSGGNLNLLGAATTASWFAMEIIE